MAEITSRDLKNIRAALRFAIEMADSNPGVDKDPVRAGLWKTMMAETYRKLGGGSLDVIEKKEEPLALTGSTLPSPTT